MKTKPPVAEQLWDFTIPLPSKRFVQVRSVGIITPPEWKRMRRICDEMFSDQTPPTLDDRDLDPDA